MRSDHFGIVGGAENSNAVLDFEVAIFPQLLHLADKIAGYAPQNMDVSVFKRLGGNVTKPADPLLYMTRPVDGKVVIDFNRATNPPCAFTPYATCPLPPRQNRLPVRIAAGEKILGKVWGAEQRFLRSAAGREALELAKQYQPNWLQYRAETERCNQQIYRSTSMPE